MANRFTHICSAHGEPAIEEWAKDVLLRQHRGDQEALNAIRDRVGQRFAVMPGRSQRLRLDCHCGDALVVHWTGEAGKQVIRAALAENGEELVSTERW